jgi:hypothetical protein
MNTERQLPKVNAAICSNKMCQNNSHVSKYVYTVASKSIAARKTKENAKRVTSNLKQIGNTVTWGHAVA